MKEDIKDNAEKTATIQQKKVPGRPFKPGQSGNPKGRPVGSVSITTEIRSRLLKVFPEKQATVIGEDGKKIKKLKKTYLQKIVETIFENAFIILWKRMLNFVIPFAK